MEEKIDKQKNIFDAYIKLSAETYELVIRNIVMNDRLSKAYKHLQQKEEMTPDEIMKGLKGSFEGIYENISSVFLRRLKLVATPFSEVLKGPSEDSAPKFGHDWYMDFFKMWAESQIGFLKGVLKGYQCYFGELQQTADSNDSDDNMKMARPSYLLRNIIDEESEVYLNTVSKYIEHFGENQFLFPKSYFIHLKSWISSYSKMLRLLSRYESIFRNGWEKSLKNFAEALASNGKLTSEIEYDEFYNLFIKTFSKEYFGLMKSREFVEAQNDVLNTICDFYYNLREMLEAQIEMFPMSPFATRSEIDTIEKRLYESQKKQRLLEKELKLLRRQQNDAPTQQDLNKLNTLTKKSRNLEKEIKEIKEHINEKPSTNDFDKLTTITEDSFFELKQKIENMERAVQSYSSQPATYPQSEAAE